MATREKAAMTTREKAALDAQAGINEAIKALSFPGYEEYEAIVEALENLRIVEEDMAQLAEEMEVAS